MKAIRYLTLLLSIVTINTIASGQVVDSFDDGDFTNNPTWTGETGSWQIVANSSSAANATGSNTLRLNAPDDGSTSQYLTTQRTGSWGTHQSWSFWSGRRSGATASDGNHSLVWLWANESNLESATVDGYRIRFGDNDGDDEIRLQRVDNGTATDILISAEAVTNIDDIGFMVRVTRTSASVWTLYTSTLPTTSSSGAVATDIPSKANTSVSQGSVTESTYTNFDNGYFGFMTVHTSGSTARTGAEFDQFYFDTDSDSSLPVELTLFTATITEEGAIIRWRTETETNNLGFRVYRSNHRDGKYVKVNPVMIPGAGTSGTAHTYEFIDSTAEKGTTYYYYLEDVAFDGSTSQSPIIRAGETPTSQMATTWGKIKRRK